MWLKEKNDYSVVDYGCFSSLSCDYSDYVPIACQGLNQSEVDLIIGSCDSGQGVNICANHQKNVISVLPTNTNDLNTARRHNCPNFISFPSKTWEPENAFKTFVNAYQKCYFQGGRHSTRIQKSLCL